MTNKLSDLREADDTSILQTLGVSAAEPQHFVLSYLPDPLPEWSHMHFLFICLGFNKYHLFSSNISVSNTAAQWTYSIITTCDLFHLRCS